MNILRYTLNGLSRDEQRKVLWNALAWVENGTAYIVGNVLFILTRDSQSLQRIRQMMQETALPKFAV